MLKDKIVGEERELRNWSSTKVKWSRWIILFFIFLVGVGIVYGPNPTTWHSAKLIDLACSDIGKLQTELPSKWQPGVDYLLGSPEPLSNTLQRLENRISDAATNTPTQYNYLSGELALLENSLSNYPLTTESGSNLPFHFDPQYLLYFYPQEPLNPSNIVALSMEPFCLARRG